MISLPRVQIVLNINVRHIPHVRQHPARLISLLRNPERRGPAPALATPAQKKSRISHRRFTASAPAPAPTVQTASQRSDHPREGRSHPRAHPPHAEGFSSILYKNSRSHDDNS